MTKNCSYKSTTGVYVKEVKKKKTAFGIIETRTYEDGKLVEVRRNYPPGTTSGPRSFKSAGSKGGPGE